MAELASHHSSRRRIDPAEDDWQRVQDPKKRKQIQDRLAQRARRKRLRDLKNTAKQSPSSEFDAPSIHGSQTSSNSDTSLALVRTVTHFTPLDPSFNSNFLKIPNIPFSDTILDNIPNPPSTHWSLSPLSQPQPPLTVFSALYINGRILNISCTSTIPAKSPPASDSVPLPLQPTALQLITVHHRWMDFFPFPKMRDNAISMGGVVDEEELCGDLFLMPSFEIVPGCPSWDPRGWRMERRFAEKWGFLFY